MSLHSLNTIYSIDSLFAEVRLEGDFKQVFTDLSPEATEEVCRLLREVANIITTGGTQYIATGFSVRVS